MTEVVSELLEQILSLWPRLLVKDLEQIVAVMAYACDLMTQLT